MKTGFLEVVCTLVSICLAGCGGEDENDKSNPTMDNCVKVWALQNQCLSDASIVVPSNRLEEACNLSLSYLSCEVGLVSDECNDVYNRYIDCTLTLDSCEEMIAYNDGVISSYEYLDSDTADFPCDDEWRAYTDTCVDAWAEIDIENDAYCVEEEEDYQTFLASFVTDSLSDSDTDMDALDTEGSN